MQQDRPRILVFPLGLMAHYLRLVRLAQELQDEFEFIFASNQRYDSFVLDAGFELVPSAGMDALRAIEDSREFSFDWLNEADLRRCLEEQVRLIREVAPDMLLGDAEPTVPLAGKATGKPVVTLHNGYMTRFYAGQRPVPSVHPGARYADKLPTGMFNLIASLAERAAFRSLQRPFNRMRREMGLPRKANYQLEQEGDLCLICDLPDLHPQSDQMPVKYLHTGPLIPRSSGLRYELPGERGARVVVCLGSSGDWQKVSEINLWVEKGLQIIAVGDRQQVLKGPHVRHMDHADMDALLPHCRAMICHGGNGTVYFGLKYRLPLVLVTSIFEQEWNAARISDLGLGVWCRDGKGEIETSLYKAMGLDMSDADGIWDFDPDFSEIAIRMKELLEKGEAEPEVPSEFEMDYA